MAERYGDELAAALPEVDAVVGFAGEGALAHGRWRSARSRRKPTGVRDLLELPAPGADGAVGLPEGGRGLRPRVRVLRHPVVPRQAALAHAGVDRGRGPQPRRGRRRRARARRAGPRLVRARHRRARLARAAAAPARHARGRRPGARPAALPLPERGARPARRDDARAADGRALLRPLAAARRRRAAATHEAVGERRPLPRRDRRHPRARSPTPRSGRRSSSASRARREREHDELLAFLDAASLDWAGFFPFSPEDGTPAATLDDAVDPRARVRAAARVRSGAGADHARGARRARRARGRGARRRARRRLRRGSRHADRPHASRGARDRRRSCACTPTGPVRARLVRAHVTEAIGPDLVAKAAGAKGARG